MFDSKRRISMSACVLLALGTMSVGSASAHATPVAPSATTRAVGSTGPAAPTGPTAPTATTAPTAPTATLSGRLVHFADQLGAGSAAVRTPDMKLVPVEASAVARLKPGSAVTLNVVVPPQVRAVASANSTLTLRGADGKTTSTPLDARDLAAASDGTAEPATSDLGRASVASAISSGQALAVSAVVSAVDPVGSYTPATRHLFVAIVTPKGWPTPNNVTPAEIGAQVANASTYWSTVTSGGVTLDVATIATPYTSAFGCANPTGLFNEAAAKTGFRGAANTSVVVVLPTMISQDPTSSCAYGLGTVGANVNDSGMLYVSDKVFPVLAHELGHNMSLRHADTLECPSASDSASDGTNWTGSGCKEVPYGDGDDVMAASRPDYAPFLSSPQSLRTGLLPASAVATISSGGTQSVTLSTLGSRSGVRAAAVVDPMNQVTYYVEYREATAPDTPHIYGDALGVRVLRFSSHGTTSPAGDTVLLDPTPTPAPSNDRDATLQVGRTFTSYSGAVHVTTMSATAASATVSITVGTNPSHVTTTSPGAPTGVTATAGNGAVSLAWAPPASNGGAGITGYTVTASPGGATASTAGTALTFTELANGTAYTFTVTATNSAGTSVASAASPPTTPMAPVAPVAPPPAVQRYVARVYSDLFGRAPDPTGLASWAAKLSSGTPRVAVANAITSSAEYRSKLISGSYAHYLRRTPDPGGLTSRLARMRSGMTIAKMEAGLIASREYYAKAGSTDRGWVSQLYRDVFARSAEPSEVAGWTTRMRRGMSRDTVAMGFLLSTERLRTVVNGYYRHLLGRGVDPSGLRSRMGVLRRGGRDEAIIGGIIASGEYYNRV